MYFDESRALKVKNFIETLRLTSGVWAGHKFELLPWQWNDVIKPLFGTLKREGGPRQYRICYVEIPKKNGKTELAAAIALYLLCADGEQSPEVYSAAADRSQAGLVFKPASYMVKHDTTLRRNIKVLDASKRMVNHRNYGFYQVLSRETRTVHGINPSGIIFDELHAQPDDTLWNYLTSGTDYAREQQLVFVMTTAGIYDKESIWWKVRERARQIRDGVIQDETFLPVLYIADPEKDEPEVDGKLNEELVKRVNPSQGHIFDMDKIRGDYKIAKQDPVDYQNFLRFRMNIPIKQAVRWIDMQKWDLGKAPLPDLKGRTCYGGLDASTKIDLTAFILVFPPEHDNEPFDILATFYTPQDTVMDRSRQDKVHYDIWAEQGFIKDTPGNTIDHRFIVYDIAKASQEYDIVSVGYDPRDATQLAQELQDDHGIRMEEIKQTYTGFSEPAKDLQAHILQGKIRHGGNPVLRWNADNIVMKVGLREEVLPAKDKSTERIDGIVALIMAWKQMMQDVAAEPKVTVL